METRSALTIATGVSRTPAVDRYSSSQTKIALFRSYFRGRDDVHARRFESRRTGRTGYSPACANEWVRGVCEKPRVKCSACAHQRFLPLTDDVLRWHLVGQDDAGCEFEAGVYPMLRDERCWFLAIDFDKADWQQDTLAVRATCESLGLPVALERSRSGQGAHLWLFFDAPVPAALARKLGAHLLTETMERRPELGFDSYDRFFPNQDTLPTGGFGNLIALPLQARARQAGNSLFVDAQFNPYRDQWAFLSSIERISSDVMVRHVERARRRGRILGVRAALPANDNEPSSEVPPSQQATTTIARAELPAKLELTLADQLYLERSKLPAALRDQLLRLAAFQNPEFYKAQVMRLPTYDKPRIIACAEETAEHVVLPRGCLDDVLRLLAKLRIDVSVRDKRFAGTPLEVTFQGTLRPEQQVAAQCLLAHDIGVLSASPAFGKTVVAAWLIAERRVNTLVLVHRRQLMEQWVERLSMFLNINRTSIGRFGGGRKKAVGHLDVAIIQSLVCKHVVSDLVREYGMVIVDECHHLSARSFELVVRRAKARYVTGLSATLIRQDGHHPIVLMQCGPVRYRACAKAAARERPFEHTVHVRPTAFRPEMPDDENQRLQFQALCQALVTDVERNRMICDDIDRSVRSGRSPLVLTQRRDHLAVLARDLNARVKHLVVLHGNTGSRAARAIAEQLAQIPPEAERVLLATGSYVGEGFDDARLDTLFLTTPVSWRGTISQYAGRLHRIRDGKTEVQIFDYADLNVPMLARMFDRRCAGYEAIGYRIFVPGSAVPGWPADVPLPVDVQWKREYAATVRRLAIDGVNGSLARRFEHAAREIDHKDKGEQRARSATEAFFFARLETLTETANRFQLNAELPIAFNGFGKMEVDLLCSDVRLVIELDGPQHLSDVEAYRRDRRKDALLQEHGYFVLRFLTEDVGKRLNDVLDRVLRTLAHLGEGLVRK
jgi:superfamily II DNA or RNA helicase/very-short-patch-repair endonuclease